MWRQGVKVKYGVVSSWVGTEGRGVRREWGGQRKGRRERGRFARDPEEGPRERGWDTKGRKEGKGEGHYF